MDTSVKKKPLFLIADPYMLCKRYIMWFRTTLFALTIVLSFLNEKEVRGCIGAFVIHGVACAVTTLVVFWNNPESIHSFTQGCKFWFMNLLFLSTTLPPRQQKSYWNHENQDYLWYRRAYFNLCISKLTSNEDSMQQESKLKEMYARLCVCFFTHIPSAFLQSHFLFQSEAWLNKDYYQWLFVVRVVFITATAFESAITVTIYEKYCHEFTVQMYKIDKQARPRGNFSKPEMFWPPRLLCLELVAITKWIFTSACFLEISAAHMSAYIMVLFSENYITLRLIPEIEKPFVNPPYGFHTVPSFWTTLVINSISSVGTRLHQNSFSLVNRLGGRSLGRGFFLAIRQIQFSPLLFIIYIYPFKDTFYFSMILFENRKVLEKKVIMFFWGLLMFTYYVFPDDGIDEGPVGMEEDDEEIIEVRSICRTCKDHYPILSGYSFYDMLFEHAFEHSMDKLETLRKLMVISLTVPINYNFYEHYFKLLDNRELTVQRLRDKIIRYYHLQVQLDLNMDELIHDINEVMRNRKLEEEFPFVSEFDEFMTTILENADEEEKIKDLKLLHTFYEFFDYIVEHLLNDKMLKISKVIGVEVSKLNPGILANQVWGSCSDSMCKHDEEMQYLVNIVLKKFTDSAQHIFNVRL